MTEWTKYFEPLRDVLVTKGALTPKIEKAFDIASNLHASQTRKDGGPYITHPVDVAIILANLDFDQDVICSALLHDTIEDCGYSKEEMTRDFGKNVATMVDSVSAINKEKYIYDDNEIYENKDFVKFSVEERTFKKLLSIGKKYPFGFYIKFADRLHNLRTIEVFKYNKQVEKVRETERWILPIAKLLNANYFYSEIRNECFKIINKKNKSYFDNYDFYHNANKSNIVELKKILQTKLLKNVFNDCVIEEIKEFQIFDELKRLLPSLDISKISQGLINKVSNYNITLLFKSNTSTKNALTEFLNIYNKELSNIISIINVEAEEEEKDFKFVVQDKLKNLFNLNFLSQEDYLINRLGTTDNVNIDIIDDENTHDIITSFIKIRTRGGDVVFMPEDCTALDFAFKIHKDIGFGFKYAIINDFPTQYPPYTKLHDNDKVEIFVERENDLIVNVAEIKWFAYVQTDFAKKALIKYFDKKLINS